MTSDLAALVDIAVGTCEGGSRKGLRIANRRVVALLALSGWEVDPETWTMDHGTKTILQQREQAKRTGAPYFFAGMCH